MSKEAGIMSKETGVETLELGVLVGIVKDGEFVGVEVAFGENVKTADAAGLVLDRVRKGLDMSVWVARQMMRVKMREVAKQGEEETE